MRSKYLWCCLLVTAVAWGQNDGNTITIPDDIQPGQVCKRTSDGLIECRSAQQLQDNPQWTETQSSDSAWATGIRVWDIIHPQATTDPLQRYCPRKKEYVLAHFQQSVSTSNLNGIIESYYWSGKHDSQAQGLIARLQNIPAQGILERSYVVQWTGDEQSLSDIPIYVRWASFDDGHPFYYFSLRNDKGCWFMEFVGQPDEYLVSDTAMARGDGSVINEIESSTPVEQQGADDAANDHTVLLENSF